MNFGGILDGEGALSPVDASVTIRAFPHPQE